ncbi:MAG: hypothetical protein IKT56_00860 [Clostridia bacterium]|nr:hypothetical protein [Clostridia bacterium]
MNWKQVKSFIIILLIVADIFLAAMLIKQTRLDVYNKEALIEIENILLESGIIVERKFLVLDTHEADIYISEKKSDYASLVAKGFLDETVSETFVKNDSVIFFGKNNETLEIGNDFEIYFSLEDYTPPQSYGSLIEDEQKIQKIRDIIKSSAICAETNDAKFSFEIDHMSEEDNLIHVQITQTLNGFRISNHILSCIFSENKLLYANGIWSFLPINEKNSAHLLDSVNILFTEKAELDAHNNTKQNADPQENNESVVQNIQTKAVLNIEQCYNSFVSLDETKLYFTPHWHIEWSDGSHSYYNALTGEKNKSMN